MIKERFSHIIDVESLCAKEAIRVVGRKQSRVLSLYLLSLSGALYGKREFTGDLLAYAKDFKSDIGWGLEVGRVARTIYFLLRHVDDLLDGDIRKPGDSLDYVINLSAQIRANDFRDDPEIGMLARYSLNVLERKARPEDNPRQNVVDIFGVMVFDHTRSRERLTLTAKQLEKYYQCTFSPITDIMLIGLESQHRASGIPALSQSQGRIYCWRDLETDWARGTINIPGEILGAASLTVDSTLEEVQASSTVKDWFQDELGQSRNELLALKKELQNSPERLTSRVCNSLIESMLKKIDEK